MKCEKCKKILSCENCGIEIINQETLKEVKMVLENVQDKPKKSSDISDESGFGYGSFGLAEVF